MASAKQSDAGSEQHHKLKLSVDLLSVKDLQVSANLVCNYSLKLSSGMHTFRTEAPTPVSQASESKLQKAFASFEFAASKSELFAVLAGNNFKIKLSH